MEQINEKNETLSWAVFMGSMFIGMGVGAYFGQTGIGLFIGMGVGYIASAIIESMKKN